MEQTEIVHTNDFFSHYNCKVCNSSQINKVKIDRLTELYQRPEIDSEGREHYHDYNKGMVYITCIKGHISHVPYKYTCKYGCHLKKL